MIKINNSFLKSIIVLASGSMIAQLMTVLTAPILTRVFNAEELGVYTYVLSVASIFMAIINGRYDMAIVSEKEDRFIYPIIKLCLFIGIGMCTIVTIGYYLYLEFYKPNGETYKFTIIFMFLLLLSYALNNILSAYNNRNKEYNTMTSVYVIRTSFQNFSAIIAGIMETGTNGLLSSYCIGQYMGINRQAKSLKPHIKDIKNVKLIEMKEVLKRHYEFPLFSSPALFINSFSYSSITIFIELLFGIETVGYYSISVRLLGLPLAIISGNISKVFFEEATKEFHNNGKFEKTFKKTFKFLFALSVPMVMGMIFFAPQLCTLFFGNEWEESGRYVVILSVMFGFKFIVTALSPGLIIANKQKMELVLQIMFIFSSIICFTITKYLGATVEFYLTLICITFSIGYLMYLIATYRYSK